MDLLVRQNHFYVMANKHGEELNTCIYTFRLVINAARL